MSANKSSAAAWAAALGLGALAIMGVVGTTTTSERTTTITQSEPVPYSTTYVEDETLDYGKTVTRVAGVNGTRTNTYKVTTRRGKETSRELVDSQVTKEPVDKVVAKGTKPVWRCHDTTSYDRNPYNDNYCEYSDGTGKYVPDSEARRLDPDYTPGKFGAPYYNNF